MIQPIPYNYQLVYNHPKQDCGGCAGNYLVGFAVAPTASHAILWNATSHTTLDLNASLASGWTSGASSVEVTPKGLTVVGGATDASSNQHAIVWFVPNALLPK